jgi:ATP synthase subunit 6
MIIYSPLEQFCITSLIRFELINTSLSFTNSSLFLLASCGSMYFLYYMSMYRATILPNNWQLALEFLYGIVANTLAQSVSNKKEAGKYFPFMFFLFSFILFSNLAGMVPYSFCVTSHLCVTFTLGLIIWVGTTFIGFKKHGFHFFSLFMPSGAPFGIMPFLIGIELLSFIFKGISISVRLFANMMAAGLPSGLSIAPE